jgi:hypothetical protein
MFILCLSKGPELVGKQCQGTGVRIGKAIPSSMAKASHSRSQLVMVVLWSPTMLLQLGGPLGRPIVVLNSRHKTTHVPLPLNLAYSLLL